MDRTSEHNMLQIRLGGDAETLTPHYLLRWLDYLPGDYEFGCISDVVISFLGLSESITAALDFDELGELRESVGENTYAFVDDGELVIRQSETDEEICRVELAEWLMRLGSLIEFMIDVYGHPLSALELRDFLGQLWHPRFC